MPIFWVFWPLAASTASIYLAAVASIRSRGRVPLIPSLIPLISSPSPSPGSEPERRAGLLQVQERQELFADAVPQLPGVRGRNFHLFPVSPQQDAVKILAFPPRQTGQELGHVQFHVGEIPFITGRLPQNMRFTLAASTPILAPLMPHNFKPSDGSQVLFQPRAFDRLEPAEQVTIVGEQRIPDAGCDFLDQIRVPASVSQREPDLPHEMPVAFRVDLGPGLAVARFAAIDQVLVGRLVRRHGVRGFLRLSSRNRQRLRMAIGMAVAIIIGTANGIAIAAGMVIFRAILSAVAVAEAVAIVMAV